MSKKESNPDPYSKRPCPPPPPPPFITVEGVISRRNTVKQRPEYDKFTHSKLVLTLKEGIQELESGYTDEIHFLFDKQSMECLLTALEFIDAKDN